MEDPNPLSDEEMDNLLAQLHIWTTKKIKCTICSHEHVSVHIIGLERVECPNCHYMTQT
jgi:hypothetical protein